MRIQDAGVAADESDAVAHKEKPQSAKNCETTAGSKLSEDCIGEESLRGGSQDFTK